MSRFSSKQKNYDIGGVEIGGQPGERPTVLIGSIFHAGHRIVQDPMRGIFDRDKAKILLDREMEMAATTGNRCFIDVVGETSEALKKYIEFVADYTSSPILVDSPLQDVRMKIVKYFAGSELVPRLIYNSIAEDYTDEELVCLKECGVKSAIVLAFTRRAVKPSDKLKLLHDELIPAAESAGIENILVDTGVLDVPSIGWASQAIHEVKEKLGYPAGCAPANAIYTWHKMKALGSPAFQAAASAVLAIAQSQGADFLFYGSLQNASWVYPAVAAVDGLIAYMGRLGGVVPMTRDHPLYKVFQ